MATFSVIFDACVLYPAPLRDLLMRLAMTDMFQARWTDDIHEEWITALIRRDSGFSRDKLERVKALMDLHVRDAKVEGYQGLIPGLSLPDPNDRHVLAAAIRSNSDAIISFNLKDFPPDLLATYEIEVIHPDDFVAYQLELSPATVCGAIRQQRQALQRPAKSAAEFLLILQKQQLPQTVSALKAYLNLI